MHHDYTILLFVEFVEFVETVDWKRATRLATSGSSDNSKSRVMIIKWLLMSRLADLAENELYLRGGVGATREGEQTRQAGINLQPFLEFPPGLSFVLKC